MRKPFDQTNAKERELPKETTRAKAWTQKLHSRKGERVILDEGES